MVNKENEETLGERLSRLTQKYEYRQRQLQLEYESAVQRETENYQRTQKLMGDRERESKSRLVPGVKR